jgi:signal peptidase II
LTKQPKRRLLAWPLLVALLTLLLDQVSKYFVVRFLDPDHPIPLLDSFLRLVYLKNQGVSFGQLQGYSTWIAIFTIVVVAGLLLGYRYLLTPSRWANAALGLILGGAIGNLIDRLIYGISLGDLAKSYVVDFVDLQYFAVFNVADSAITVGGIIYAVYLVFHRDHQTEERAKEKPWPTPRELPPAE